MLNCSLSTCITLEEADHNKESWASTQAASREKDEKSPGCRLHREPAISFPSTNKGTVVPERRMISRILWLTSSGHRETHLLSVCVHLIIREQWWVYETLLPLLALLNRAPFTEVLSTLTTLIHTHIKSVCTVADHSTIAALTEPTQQSLDMTWVQNWVDKYSPKQVVCPLYLSTWSPINKRNEG